MSAELTLERQTPESHNRSQGLNGTFKKTLEVIEISSEARILTLVAPTVTDLNLESRCGIPLLEVVNTFLQCGESLSW